MAKRDPKAEARRAYGDLHNLPERSLEWQGSATTPREFCEIVKAVVPRYNEFNARRVCDLLRDRPVKVALAREGSPAIYVSGSPKALTEIARDATGDPDIAVDAASYEGPGRKSLRVGRGRVERAPKGSRLRLWWD